MFIDGLDILAGCTALPETEPEKVAYKGQILNVFKASNHQTTADLGFIAATRTIELSKVSLSEIGALLFLSRTPDFRGPNTAAILQGRLNLTEDCICFDINAGVNAFSIGIETAAAILKGINKKSVLLIFGDTPSKLHSDNFSYNQLESDCATAILLGDSGSISFLSSNYYDTDFFEAYFMEKGGFRNFDRFQPFDSTATDSFNFDFNPLLIKEGLHKSLNVFRTLIEKEQRKTEDFRIDYHINFDLFIEGLINEDEYLSLIGKYGFTGSSFFPLLLFNRIISDKLNNNNQFISWGEGICLTSIEFNGLNRFPNDTIFTEHIFEDFRVTHEM